MLTFDVGQRHVRYCNHASIPPAGRCTGMTNQSKTPGRLAKRGRNIPDQEAVATPAKSRALRTLSVAAEQAEAHIAPVSDVSGEQAPRQQACEAPADFVERQPTAEAKIDASCEDPANRTLEAITTLGEMFVELRTEIRGISDRLDQIAANMSSAGQVASAHPQRPGADMTDDGDRSKRDRDPGDAVPPGVAVMSPTSLTKSDETVLHSLEELPRHVGRGRRGTRAKA